MQTTHATSTVTPTPSVDDVDRWYRAIVSRDARFDGWILVGVTSTGIYCRPSCPTPVRPKRTNVTFHATAAAAQRAGFRACKRCRPDAVPGSPAWDVRGDLVGRAMRRIADGAIDRGGVPGLAASLAVSERQLRRVLTQEVGAGPLAIARANRAQTARVLIETTVLPFGDVAFAAGFTSIRQFSDTIREVFATTPTGLRSAASRSTTGTPAAQAGLTIRLPLRPPFDGSGLLAWFAMRAVEGVETVGASSLRRTLDLPGGPARVTLRPHDDHVEAHLSLTSVADLGTAVARLRRLLDLDADPERINETLGSDRVLQPLVQRRPGLRVPGTVDGGEIAIKAILGQQVSVAAAATAAARLTALVGVSVGEPVGEPVASDLNTDANDVAGLTRLFPRPADVAALTPGELGMPTGRAAALIEVCRLLAEGALDLGVGAERDRSRRQLLAVKGIGPWTANYIALRALGDPDVFLHEDLIVRRRAEALGLTSAPLDWAARFSPWRSYVTHHLWASSADAPNPVSRP